MEAVVSNSATPVSDSITLLRNQRIPLPPSCIEFLPITSYPIKDYCVVGTYDLQKDGEVNNAGPQVRNGSLNLYYLQEDGRLIPKSNVLTDSAVLDLHFWENTRFFAVSDSTGGISIWEVATSKKQNKYLKQIIRHQIFPKEDEVLILSFAWREPCGVENPPNMALTTSTGGIHIIQFENEWTTLQYSGNPIYSHSQKAECCVWSRQLPSRIFTGGDDVRESTLRMRKLPYSMTAVFYDPGEEIVIFKQRPHESGLTALLSLPGPKNGDVPVEDRHGLFPASDNKNFPFSTTNPILLTGGYDGYVRVYAPFWSLPPGGSPELARGKTLTELEIGGGVWKVKLMGFKTVRHGPGDISLRYRVLASCMHAGARVLDVTYNSRIAWTITVLGSVSHELNYASDFLPPRVGHTTFTDKRICVSTSFYDRLLSVWEFRPPVDKA